MSMKKNISKALAMAVMMSVLAGGSAYAFTGGLDAYADGDGVAIGGNAHSGNKGVAVGYYTNASKNGVAIGNHQNITDVSAGENSVAIGTAANAINQFAVAIGNDATASKNSNIAVGSGTTASGEYAVVLGINSSAVGKNSIALGYAAVAKEKNSVALGYESVASEENTVSVGAEGSERKIVNVAKGDKDTDAVNFSQIKAVDGNYVKEANTVAQNFTALDTQVKTNADDIAKKADKAALDAEVKAREQGDADTLKKANAYTDEQVKALTGTNAGELVNKINETDARLDRVGATAAALAGIHYQPMAKGQSQVAVGMGGYKGKKATALGLAYQISDRVSGSVAGAANGSERMFNVGFNYLFGQHSDKDIAQCAAVPGSMSLKEAELQAQVDSLKADNQAMKAHIAKQDAEMAELKAMVKALAAK